MNCPLARAAQRRHVLPNEPRLSIRISNEHPVGERTLVDFRHELMSPEFALVTAQQNFIGSNHRPSRVPGLGAHGHGLPTASCVIAGRTYSMHHVLAGSPAARL